MEHTHVQTGDLSLTPSTEDLLSQNSDFVALKGLVDKSSSINDNEEGIR